MSVGLAAAKAIKDVHGMDYTVGSSPNVLCEYPYIQQVLLVSTNQLLSTN